MKHQIKIESLKQIDDAAKLFLKEISGARLLAFHAPMGAGKTTFTSAICRALGVEADAVGSPTFSIINEYRTSTGEPVFHFDFYRLEKASEILDIGLYDYLDSGYLCIMEWPENAEGLLPSETLDITISVNPDESRTVCWED